MPDTKISIAEQARKDLVNQGNLGWWVMQYAVPLLDQLEQSQREAGEYKAKLALQIAHSETSQARVAELTAEVERATLDAARWRALMTIPRIKMQGSAGVDPKTGERTNGTHVHFGAEFWTEFDGDSFPHLKEGIDQSTAWGRRALTATADALIARQAHREGE